MSRASSLPPAQRGLPEAALTAARFDRAAARFDAACAAHDHAREVLLQRLNWFDLQPQCVVDFGCGTGRAGERLREHFPDAHLIGLDCSSGMLDVLSAARRPYAQLLHADACAAPLPDDSVDLAIANLLLPWCDPEALFRELARVMKPDALLLLSTTGPGTLAEVRTAWRAVDDAVHVHAGLDLQTLGELATRAGLREPVLDIDAVTLEYSALDRLHEELRATAAVNAAGGRRRTLTGARRFAAYRAQMREQQAGGPLGITAQFVYAQAFGAAPPQRFAGIEIRPQ